MAALSEALCTCLDLLGIAAEAVFADTNGPKVRIVHFGIRALVAGVMLRTFAA
jgi:hypothetical protein